MFRILAWGKENDAGVQPAPSSGNLLGTIRDLFLDAPSPLRYAVGLILLATFVPPGSEVQVTGELSDIDKIDPATHQHVGYSVWAPVKITKTPSAVPSVQESVVPSSVTESTVPSTGRSAAIEGPSTGLQRGETDGLALSRETIKVFTATGPNGTGIYFRNIGTKPILLVSLVPSCAAPTQCPPIYNKLVAPVKVVSDGAHDYTYSAATQWLFDFTWEAQLVTPQPSAISR
ncbi:MAG: hypothetical protein ACXWNZ_02140 [Vulcanimicrobiaceae bacterium]